MINQSTLYDNGAGCYSVLADDPWSPERWVRLHHPDPCRQTQKMPCPLVFSKPQKKSWKRKILFKIMVSYFPIFLVDWNRFDVGSWRASYLPLAMLHWGRVQGEWVFGEFLTHTTSWWTFGFMGDLPGFINSSLEEPHLVVICNINKTIFGGIDKFDEFDVNMSCVWAWWGCMVGKNNIWGISKKVVVFFPHLCWLFLGLCAEKFLKNSVREVFSRSPWGMARTSRSYRSMWTS